MALLHTVEKRGSIVQIDAGPHSAAAEGGESKFGAGLGSLTPGQGFAQGVLEKSGQCSAPLGRQLLGFHQKLLVEADRGSHVSKHTVTA
jgi:hypothetical protein